MDNKKPERENEYLEAIDNKKSERENEDLEMIDTKKSERKSKYLKALSTRLAEKRKEMKITQGELAKATNINKDKIIYAEQNINGRLLKIEELAEIAKYLNVSVDYLLGLSDEKKAISKSTDDIADNNSTNLQAIINNEDNENIYKLYESIVYITRSTLTSTLGKIKQLVEKKSNLSSLYINQIASADYFIKIITHLNIPLLKINNEQKEILKYGIKAMERLLDYNEDKDLSILYEDMEKMKIELEEIGDYLLYKLIKCNIDKSIETLARKNIQNARYYKNINSFISEYSNGLKPRT